MKAVLKKLMFWCLYYSRFFYLCRWLNRKYIPILVYHGISSQETPEWTQLPLDVFEQQMHYLKQKFHVVSLSETINYIKGKEKIPDYAVVVTFDDGYQSNFTIAKSVLDKYDIPATVFITTSFIRHDEKTSSYLWFDQVYNAFLNTKQETVTVDEIQLGTLTLSTAKEKITAAEHVIDRLKVFSTKQKNKLVKDIVLKLNPPQIENPRYKGANWTEIRQAYPRISVGAHTVNHEILTRVPLPQAVKEIEASKTVIERSTGLPVAHFAYPNGRSEDFNTAIIDAVKNALYQGAVTTIEGLNRQYDNVYTLKRIAVGSNIDYIHFVLLVSGTIDFVRKIIGKYTCG